MKYYAVTVILCVTFLIVLNILVLNSYSPSQPDTSKECESRIRELYEIIENLQKSQETDQDQSWSKQSPSPSPTTIHMITPTYSRWTQKADLTRLCQTLMHIPNLHWIVVEDSETTTDLVKRFLKKCRVNSTHLNVRTKVELQRNDGEPIWKKSRGVEQRNVGLKWLRSHYKPGTKDVVYFGDDDNTYDLQLFEEIRSTRRLSVWPVGICGGLKWEGPVCDDGKVKAWHTSWAKTRSFPIDFAGFAISLDLILQYPTVYINPDSKIGWLESDFLSQMISSQEAKAGADNCTKVYVWHTRTEKPKTKDEDKLISQGRPSNPLIEV